MELSQLQPTYRNAVGTQEVTLQYLESKRLKNHEIDIIYADGNLTLTIRTLPNNDTFLYYDYQGPKTELLIELGEITQTHTHDYLYQKPPYDQRYGENKLTGLHAYLDLAQGSVAVSKLYCYETLTQIYGGGQSTLYHLIQESADLYIENNHRLCIPLFAGSDNQQSGFVLLSASKLFADTANLDAYMSYVYDGIANNNVWCSFFTTPAGTYCKLPYSIEPFTKDGYGYSLQHSSRKDMIVWFRDTGERFFENFIGNAIYQAYLYQEQQDGMFLTPFTSNWLKKDTGITAPYADSRLNENFIAMLDDFKASSPWFADLDPLKGYADFWVGLYEKEMVYRSADGVFFPDYYQPDNIALAHTSLNHQIGIALALLKAYQKYNVALYFELFQKIATFINATAPHWINTSNGDLFYGIKYDEHGKLVFFDKDYVYVTLYDLLALQLACMERPEIGYSQAIEQLVTSKVTYLKATDYDLLSDSNLTPSGEPTNLKKLTQDLYEKVNRIHSSN